MAIKLSSRFHEPRTVEGETTQCNTVNKKKKSSLLNGFCRFCKRYADGFCIRNGAKLSEWILDSQEFRVKNSLTSCAQITAR